MVMNPTGIDKKVEIDRKENLRKHRLYWIGRRTQDVILSSLALVALSPVMLATAIAIVVDDPSAGPVFSQERIGRNGKPFKFYKFRSMCPNAEAKLDDGQKLVQGMQVHEQLMLQIMPQRIAAHHLLCLFVQLAIDKNQWLIKI